MMQIVKRKNIWVVAAAALSVTVLLAGCTPPGASGGGAAEGNSVVVDAPVTPADVAKLGAVTLKVWADSGEEATLKDFVPTYEKKYPNVTVKVTTKSFDDLIKTVVNAMNSNDAPDLAQGNQGYAVDGTLVQAKLIRPLDDIATAYGWDTTYSKYSLDQFRWNDAGTAWGSGTLYANSPVTQYIGVFDNTDLLAQAGVSAPTSFEEMAASLPVLKAAGITPIVFGNSDKQAAMHLMGSLAGRCQAASDVNDWVAGKSGTTFVNDCNTQAAQTLVDWVNAGYIAEGFNGVSMDDAANRFAEGGGAYFIGGDWLAQQISATKGNFGFTNLTGDTGKLVSTGASGMGWHISSKSKATLAAAAFIGDLHAKAYGQALADQNRVPIAAPTATSTNPLMNDDLQASGRLLADNGQTAFLDWATDDMYDVFGSSLQELMAGQKTPAQFVQVIQDDWTAFQSKK